VSKEGRDLADYKRPRSRSQLHVKN